MIRDSEVSLKAQGGQFFWYEVAHPNLYRNRYEFRKSLD